MNLVYFTVGFNPEYIKILYLAIKSLRKRNAVDVMIICDESLIETCSAALKEFSNIIIAPCENSNDAPDSSMKKLQIFKYDLSKYSKILFIDSDVLIGRSLDCFFDGIKEDKLYSSGEGISIINSLVTHSLLNYTEDQLSFLEKNKIKPFNCGFFGFLNNSVMKQHFDNILEMVKTHTGYFFYEQSFMNVYFNLRNLTDLELMNRSNYIIGFRVSEIPDLNLFFKKSFRKNKVVHFAYSLGYSEKLKMMKKYYNLFVE